MEKVNSRLQVQRASEAKNLKAQTDEVPTLDRKTSGRLVRHMSTKIRLKTDISDYRISAA